jgi:hypothetical protein
MEVARSFADVPSSPFLCGFVSPEILGGMMDADSERSVRLLEALAAANFKLRDFGYRAFLKSSSGAWASQVAFSGSPYFKGGFSKDTYTRCFLLGVYATLPDGRAVIWGLDLLWDAKCWTIEASIELEDNQESTLLREFPKRSAHTIDDCIARIEESIDELTRNMDILSDMRIAANVSSGGDI